MDDVRINVEQSDGFPIATDFECEFRTYVGLLPNPPVDIVPGGDFCHNGNLQNVGDAAPGVCPPADKRSPSVCIGNPIGVSLGKKVDYFEDWRSSLDPRFTVSRNYTAAGGYGSAGQPYTGFGRGWDFSLEKTIWRSKPTRRGVYVGNSAIYVFTGAGNLVREIDDHSMLLEENVVSEGGKTVLTYDNGQQDIFEYISDSRALLVASRFSDGYTLSFEYNAENKLIAVSDNRGQRAEFARLPIGQSNPLGLVDGIQIDLDYDGVSFAPEVSVDYSYANPSGSGDPNALIRSHVTDLITSQTLADWEYGYNGDTATTAANFPYLTSVKDNRLSASGSHFDYAEFGYSRTSVGSANIYRAISSSHFGGADLITTSTPGCQSQSKKGPSRGVKLVH